VDILHLAAPCRNVPVTSTLDRTMTLNLLGIRYKCPVCAAEARLPAESQFKCPHCGAELQSNPNVALIAATLLGGVPAVVGSAFGEIGNAIGLVASVAFMLALWRGILQVRRRDAV